MDYLSGKLSGQEKHEVEKWMADNEFANEAVEGLQKFEGKKDLQGYVDQLNNELNQYIRKKKDRRERRKIKELPWLYITIVFVLLVIIIVYLVLDKLQAP